MNWDKFLLSSLPLLFAIFWLAIMHLTAWLGGWSRLAREFADDGTHTDRPIQRRWFQSGSFGLMNYNGALSISVYEAGVRVSVLWPLRPGHAPLFIPWNELREPRVRRVFPFVRRLEVRVGDPPVKVLLPVWVAEGMRGPG